MSRFLLDTHVWLWLQSDPERIDSVVLDQLADQRNELLLSAASSWELSIKHALGRIELPQPPATYVPDRLRRSGVVPLAIEHAHVLAVGGLPLHHRDPFDRLLIAQAQMLGLPLVTADRQMERYDIEIVSV